jgi:hypothetical protein
MTRKTFFVTLFLQGLILTCLKVLFFKYFNYSDPNSQVVFIAITIVPMVILVRALGIMSFIEAFLISIFWVLLGLLLDVLFTSSFIGASVFSQGVLWSGYIVIVVVVFVFHKKRHVHVRNQLIARKHAAAQAAAQAQNDPPVKH